MSKAERDEIIKLARECGLTVTLSSYGALMRFAEAIRKKWQPISTVPKDATVVLVYLEEPILKSRIQPARFDAKNGVTIIGPLFGFDAPKPTHWMPLPESPEDI